ncbi:uncharacterized protein LOC130367430 [Hyla sarda]|uniref:uncharacterized protein LOC130367430 n=1 Tax=Hyla sarda TaxID=327740 RepID=UPI0024C2D53F|nr:uncharacterized protein LOC130367430 [Hyla sarda]
MSFISSVGESSITSFNGNGRNRNRGGRRRNDSNNRTFERRFTRQQTSLKNLHLFARKLALKKLHTKRIQTDSSSHTLDTPSEREALQALESLIAEQEQQPTGRNELIIILEAARAKGILSQKQMEGLLTPTPTISTIYLLPKIHKNETTPPGRPIVSGSNSLTESVYIWIYKDQGGYLQTDLYRKTTAANTLLHASSAHPQHLTRNIPVGQFLRDRRLCSTEGDFEKQAEDLKTRFKERGYSGRCIRRAYNRAKNSNRTDLLQKCKFGPRGYCVL